MIYEVIYKKREVLIDKADSITEQYLELATELLDKYSNFGNYSVITHTDIYDDGITFEYWIDCCDYTQGKGCILVSKEKLDKNIENFLRKKKLKLLKK